MTVVLPQGCVLLREKATATRAEGSVTPFVHARHTPFAHQARKMRKTLCHLATSRRANDLHRSAMSHIPPDYVVAR